MAILATWCSDGGIRGGTAWGSPGGFVSSWRGWATSRCRAKPGLDSARRWVQDTHLAEIRKDLVLITQRALRQLEGKAGGPDPEVITLTLVSGNFA